MKRREFITLLGATALVSPLAAQAQQHAPGKWRIGMLAPEIRQKPLREGLRELGYVEGQNLLIEWRFDDRVDRLAALATELAGLKPDVIVANGTQAAQAAQQVTKSIPIVMVASNPIGNGLVESLAHPGGNITGLSLLTPELSGCAKLAQDLPLSRSSIILTIPRQRTRSKRHWMSRARRVCR